MKYLGQIWSRCSGKDCKRCLHILVCSVLSRTWLNETDTFQLPPVNHTLANKTFYSDLQALQIIFDAKIEYYLPRKNLPIWDPNLPTKNCRSPYLSPRKDHLYGKGQGYSTVLVFMIWRLGIYWINVWTLSLYVGNELDCLVWMPTYKWTNKYTESWTSIWATSWENLFMPYANNKGADQPVHPRSLISAFVVCWLDNIIPLLALAEIPRN